MCLATPVRSTLWTVYLVAVVSGAALAARGLSPALAETPRLAAAGALAFGCFGAAVAWLLSRISYFRRPPAAARWLAFLWGALAATGYAMLANTAIRDHLAARGDPEGWLLFAPFTEEPLKDLGIVIVLLLAAPRVRTALDGLVVGSFVGLGFEVVENIAQSVNTAIAEYPAGQRDNLGSLATDVIHEIVRRSWTGHIVITGVAGFGIAYLMTARDRSPVQRWGVAVALVATGLAGHLLWNSHRFGVFYVIGQFAILALFLWLIRVGRDLQAGVYLPYLTATGTEAESIRSAGSRRAARAAAGRIGSAARRGEKARQRALADLAVARADGGPEATLPAAHRSTKVQ